ncbi:hypothetical protein OX283_007650 [Flavobacterium sp. SUN052]|uniref:hypothetical protein n=1 Tax=Flavobacterium sp. SUN052 TaxID=3002441 RepID=UPI00237D94D8|nr:hypothetical protein [Flavobacterium sp. SUN052]MEC4004527.1 hypothetical protein [Flavobacterium sp. SUN052]
MKLIKIANTIAIGIPFLLFLIGFIDSDFFLYAPISLIFTGAVQTIIAFILWMKNRKSALIPFYLLFSITFFAIFFLFRDFNLDDVFNYPFWILPILLTLYLTVIIHFSKNESFQNQK